VFTGKALALSQASRFSVFFISIAGQRNGEMDI